MLAAFRHQASHAHGKALSQEVSDKLTADSTAVMDALGCNRAALIPVDALIERTAQRPLLPLAGSGRGLWGRDSTATQRRLRDEWDR
ncbi:MAG: hypothetical protein FJ191_00785 [Gammaproteobacteria bacterium]|nr:hypothetical protein [Gammaproteobacteria bacterium]